MYNAKPARLSILRFGKWLYISIYHKHAGYHQVVVDEAVSIIACNILPHQENTLRRCLSTFEKIQLYLCKYSFMGIR